MARYLHIRAGFVINIVEYGAQTPALLTPEGDYVIPDPGAVNVGAAFDIPAYLSLQARPVASALVDSTMEIGKLMRAVAGVLIDELNTLRQEAVKVVTFTWDPASIANGAGLTSPNAPATGAAFGDEVTVIAPYSLQGLTLTGYVVSAGNIVARLENQTGGAIDLASNANWKAVVRRTPAAGYPDRTLAQARTAIQGKINAGTVDA